MSHTVDLTIGGRTYSVGVPSGQEARLRHVAARLDAEVGNIRAAVPDVDRDRLLVLAGLQIADALVTCQEEQETEQTTVAGFHESLAARLEKLVA
jgi:cell division protein ZapA (FtsZ GTPase activity inhibitor)